MLMWYNDLEIYSVSDGTKLGVHHFILSHQMCLSDALLSVWGFFCVCFFCCFGLFFFPRRVDEKR